MQRNYELDHPIASPGLLFGNGEPRVQPYVNAAGLEYQIIRVTVSTATANATYTVTINNFTASYTADAAPTTASIRDGLFLAMRNNPEFMAQAKVEVLASTSINLIASDIYTSLDAIGSSGLTVTETQVASPEPPVIPFGRFVATDASFMDRVAYLPQDVNDRIIGVTLSTHAVEKMGVGIQAQAGYKPFDTMNIIDRTVNCVGVWVECIQDDIDQDNNLFVSYAAGTEGVLSRISSLGRNVTDQVNVVRKPIKANGRNLICVSLNF